MTQQPLSLSEPLNHLDLGSRKTHHLTWDVVKLTT